MAVFELSLDQLKSYQGRNPKPTDFDDYWDKALMEMRSIDPAVELVPADFQTPFAECFHLFFTGVQGARIHAKYIRPRHASQPHPALLLFHGYTGSSGDWADKMGYAALGFSVAALDARGQGGRSQDTGSVLGNTHCGQIIRGLDDHPEKLYFRQVFLDTAQLAAIVMHMDEVDSTRVGAMGMSQGGALTLACAALEPKIARLAPMCPFLCDYKRVWEMDLAVDAYAELKTYFRLFDPRHERENEIFTRLGYIDCQHLANRIKGKTMMAIGLMDEVCPPSTQFAAFNKITAPKECVLYPDFMHESYPGFRDKAFQFFSEMI
ncbi:MAG TPA: alpha/beta fold hydrolase [Candidatus Hydrogenedentes bacterium]|jgi:cephalosporin-C deacetylase|nr:MAG: Cephalosporin-C deacetylase [Candidatus Hydrogenedentes bacterium ADurb.Bin170]HNZ47331.1 alpha/beta fold hydrolase [Candidatus Hydrogenedentota bacterium]HOD96308.1 alpha/beta fold hydrolase [Candidatus Hydrogenedentota bacterium]HOH41728.1 alpha/beta fold hydrolase [Candidatus Hydrogenedentota bacterium]HOM47315.1 alpha/beta fold hydrolase [Candidatus Hydrogenedentota bacterium]